MSPKKATRKPSRGANARDEPLIVLFGGAPGVGKSALAAAPTAAKSVAERG